MKNANLRFDITETTTTNPVDSQEIYTAALIQGGSMKTFTPIFDVKDKARIKKGGFGDVLQNESCTFNDQGAGTLTEKLYTPCSIDVNIEICQRTLETSFVSHTMKPGANHPDFLPADFVKYLSTELALKMNADYEVLTWQGSTAATMSSYPIPLCDGINVQLTADATVGTVSATASFTVANVIGELNSIYNKLTDAIKFSQNLVFYVPTSLMGVYKQAIAAASTESYYVKDAIPIFLGIPLILAQGLPTNEVVAGETNNFFLISDLFSDFDQIVFLEMLDRTGDNTIRIRGRMKFGVTYAYGAEIVHYS